MSSLKPSIVFTESSLNLGGQEFQILHQIQSLNALGYQTILCCKKNSQIDKLAKKYNLVKVNIRFRNAIDFISIIKLYRILNLYNPLAIMMHSGHDSNIGAITANLHNLFSNKKIKIIRMKTYLAGYPKSFSYNYLFDMTYTPSISLRNQLLINSKINSKKIQVLYPGVDLKKLDEASAIPLNKDLAKWLVNHPGPVISHCAMLRGEKGHQFFIDAFSKVVRDFPTARYVIAGEGPERTAIENQIKELGLEENIYMAGLVYPNVSLLKISTLAVLPSIKEPLGLFQIEAQYLEVPVIASAIDGIIETISSGKTGLLASPTTEEWVKALLWALENVATMQVWGKLGRQSVIEKFSLKTNIDNLIKALE